MSRMLQIVGAAVATYAIGFFALAFAGSQSLAWYATVVKPNFVPPVEYFVPIWIVLHAFMSVALAVVLSHKRSMMHRAGWVRFYFIMLLFGAAWVIFFFGIHSIFVGFVASLFLAFIVLALMAGAWEIDRRATYLLTPYLACVLFISFANLTFWFLN